MVRGRVGQSKHVKIKRSVKGGEKWPDFSADEGRINTMKVSNKSQYSNNESKTQRLVQNKRNNKGAKNSNDRYLNYDSNSYFHSIYSISAIM